jgi:hypothetical protein
LNVSNRKGCTRRKKKTEKMEKAVFVYTAMAAIRAATTSTPVHPLVFETAPFDWPPIYDALGAGEGLAEGCVGFGPHVDPRVCIVL